MLQSSHREYVDLSPFTGQLFAFAGCAENQQLRLVIVQPHQHSSQGFARRRLGCEATMCSVYNRRVGERFVAFDSLQAGYNEGSWIGALFALRQANHTYILSAGGIFLVVYCSYEFNDISSQGSALSLELHQPIRNLIL